MKRSAASTSSIATVVEDDEIDRVLAEVNAWLSTMETNGQESLKKSKTSTARPRPTNTDPIQKGSWVKILVDTGDDINAKYGKDGTKDKTGKVIKTAASDDSCEVQLDDGTSAWYKVGWLCKIQPWDVARESNESILDTYTKPANMFIRGALGVSFGAVAGLGYGVGKIGETLGAGKAIDSKVFQASFSSWMYANGIFPSVQYESIPKELAEQLANLVRPGKLADDDMSMTSIIVSNHVSYLDGIVLASVFGAPKIVAKAGVRETPLLGKLMEEMEVIFVERDQANSRRTTLDAIHSHCQNWKNGDRPLLIFPEGTTTNGETLAPFKKGAFTTGQPVRPVVITYTGRFDPSNPTYKETEAGLEEISDIEWAANVMGGRIHSMHVRVLPPYIPTKEEAEDATLYAFNVQKHMAAELARIRSEQEQQCQITLGLTRNCKGCTKKCRKCQQFYCDHHRPVVSVLGALSKGHICSGEP